jgi:hypothetical protein
VLSPCVLRCRRHWDGGRDAAYSLKVYPFSDDTKSCWY